MRCSWILFVLAAFLITGCGRTEPESPTAPSPTPSPGASPQFPQLTGVWLGTLLVTTTAADGSTSTSSCDLHWNITSQTGDSFSGPFAEMEPTLSQAQCDARGFVSGIVSSGRTVTATFEELLHAFSNCQRVSGTGIYTGQVTDEPHIVVETSDRIECGPPPFPGRQRVDGDRTLRITIRRVQS